MSTIEYTHETNMFRVIYLIDKESYIHKLSCIRKDSTLHEEISIQCEINSVIPLYNDKKCFICSIKTNGFLCVECKKTNADLSQFRKQSLSYIKIGYKNVSCDPTIKSKKEVTCLNNYGVKNPSHNSEIKKTISEKNSANFIEADKKRRETLRDRYGVDHYSKTDDFKEKYKKTSIEKYGVDHVLQSEEVKNKISDTNIKKYGVSYPSQSDEVKNKISDTNIKKYGTAVSVHSEHIKEKIIQENLKKYGVEHSIQRDDIIQKAVITRQMKKYGDLLENFKEEWRKEYFKNGVHSALEKFPLIGYKTAIDNFLDRDERVASGGRSENERDLINILEKNTGIKFESSVRSIVPSNNRLEIDILNREHKISIEFNGYYYHQILVDKLDNDLKKAEEMRNAGWNHISIDETDIKRYNFISSIINPNKTKIYARKTIIKKVSANEERVFLTENHLFGYVPSKISYGLYDSNDNLLMIMTFGKDRYGKSEMELLRLATLKNYIVIGGAEKLFSNFVKNNDINSITTYSDNKYFSGKIFHKLGFELIGNTPKNYIWKKGSVEYTRYQTMKHKLSKLLTNFNSLYTEEENMQNNGFIKIKDLGNKKWLWNRP